MKKMLLLASVLLSLLITGCSQPVIDVSGIADEIESTVSEMTIAATTKTIEEGNAIYINYSGLNILSCNASLISEWGEPIVIGNTNISGGDLYVCSIENNLKPGKYFLTFTTATEKSNTIEICIVTTDRTPYISKIVEGSNSVKIYGNNFIKGYAPVVVCDGQKAIMSSFSETCVEIKKPTAGQHTIQLISGEVESNTVILTTK